jgi:hypothetical protein
MALGSAERMARHRQRAHERGLRPVQTWALDSARPGLAEELARQCRAVNASADEAAALEFTDAAARDIEGWE